MLLDELQGEVVEPFIYIYIYVQPVYIYIYTYIYIYIYICIHTYAYIYIILYNIIQAPDALRATVRLDSGACAIIICIYIYIISLSLSIYIYIYTQLQISELSLYHLHNVNCAIQFHKLNPRAVRLDAGACNIQRVVNHFTVVVIISTCARIKYGKLQRICSPSV